MNLANSTEWQLASPEQRKQLSIQHRIERVKNCGVEHTFDGKIFKFLNTHISYDPYTDTVFYKKNSVGLGSSGIRPFIELLTEK